MFLTSRCRLARLPTESLGRAHQLPGRDVQIYRQAEFVFGCHTRWSWRPGSPRLRFRLKPALGFHGCFAGHNLGLSLSPELGTRAQYPRAMVRKAHTTTGLLPQLMIVTSTLSGPHVSVPLVDTGDCFCRTYYLDAAFLGVLDYPVIPFWAADEEVRQVHDCAP